MEKVNYVWMTTNKADLVPFESLLTVLNEITVLDIGDDKSSNTIQV